MFNNKDISVIAYANGFTLWHYITKDSLSDICANKYFHLVRDIIHDGDIIILNYDDGVCFRIFSKQDGIIALRPLEK